MGERHSGEFKRKSAEVKAERITGKELKRLGGSEAELGQRPRSAPSQPALAARPRRETNLTLAAVARRFRRDAWKILNARLHRWRKVNDIRKR